MDGTVHERLLHAGPRSLLRDYCAVIVNSTGDDRPAVIPLRLNEIDFIAAAGAMFVLEESAGPRIDGETLGIPIAVGVDLRSDRRTADDGVCRPELFHHHAVEEFYRRDPVKRGDRGRYLLYSVSATDRKEPGEADAEQHE